MPKIKKFNTFGGVFTPSILTILGVIMYLRLPWIVGQAGFITTVGIILLAHLISISTGLSVASIATDKKVKAGGTYYMISRSLGLPIGGTLGLALFAGLSLSVSLYLIGFAESFLHYWGFEITKSSIQLTGTILLIIVTVVTFLSTSLAIKTQYLIMVTIGLSLVSVFFGHHVISPSGSPLLPENNSIPFIVLFGIFFPAVTGFEAGVSMSGDLQNPKKSIPVGTISAILLGLFIYIGLAYFLSTHVPAEILISDPGVLLKISFIPELVIAGIWGATLSSALGSILGAPRILQAISSDNIINRFFSRGYGNLNEPRNALLLTFLIAEAGILIGDLDVIARIVSMFFITTYGFLNLSCVIENWASSDFLPDFKIPGIVSIIGAAACFIVMIELDIVAMIGSTIILCSLYIYLKRKELSLETGDAWNSVWASVVRKGLMRLSKNALSQDKWKPNVLLFSGGAEVRPHLIEMGNWIVGKLGLISNFQLLEDSNADFPVNSIREKEKSTKEIFTKSVICRNIYEGIKTITRIYGFSGVEPNTVLMGWGRETKGPQQFADLIKSFNEQNLNTVFLSYNKDRKFGNCNSIDIWWRGAGNNFVFQLFIIRFLTSGYEWRDSKIRILIINQTSTNTNRIYRNVNQILYQYRINGEIVIIDNEIEQRSPFDIIKSESAHTDLVVLGIQDITPDNVDKCISNLNSLTLELGSALLVNASTFFESINAGFKTSMLPRDNITESFALPVIKANKNKALEPLVISLNKRIEPLFTSFTANITDDIVFTGSKYHLRIKELFDISLKELNNSFNANNFAGLHKEIVTMRTRLIPLFDNLLNDYLSEISGQSESLKDGLQSLIDNIQAIINEQQKRIKVLFSINDIILHKNNNLRDLLFRFKLKIMGIFTGSSVSVSIKFKAALSQQTSTILSDSLSSYLSNFENSNYKLFSDTHNSINLFFNTLNVLLNKSLHNESVTDSIYKELNIIDNYTNDIISRFRNDTLQFKNTFLYAVRDNFQSLLNILEDIKANRIIRSREHIKKDNQYRIDNLLVLPSIWKGNVSAILCTIKTNLIIEKYRNNVIDASETLKAGLDAYFYDYYTGLHIKTNADIDSAFISGLLESENRFTTHDSRNTLHNKFSVFFDIISDSLIDIPAEAEVIGEHFSKILEKEYTTPGELVSIPLRKTVEFYMENNLIGILQSIISEIYSEIIKTNQTSCDVINLAQFSLQNLDSDTGRNSDFEIQQILNSSKERITENTLKLEEYKHTLYKEIDRIIKEVFELLQPYRIIKSSEEISSRSREVGNKKVISLLKKMSGNLSKLLHSIMENIFYKNSRGILFARKVASGTKKDVTASDFYYLAQSFSPSKTILDTLPPYYKKLFSRKASAGSEFWIGRTMEMTECSKAVKQFFEGHNGGLLITGERNYGKSSLSRFIADKYFERDAIFTLNPVPGGCIDISKFDDILCKAMNCTKSIEDKLSASHKKAIIVNDLELWWERSACGFNVIDHLCKLIAKYGSDILFIINMNIHSYKFIKAVRNFDHFFLNIIKCEPFNAEELKNIILIRHRASGMKLMINNKPIEELSPIKIARLFNRIFNYSHGNIGAALSYWLKSIKKVESNTIFIDNSDIGNLDMLESLPDSWLLYIEQVLIHRRMKTETLSSLLGDDAINFHKTIDELKRTGIFSEYDKNILEINPVFEPFLIEHLVKKEIL